MSVYVIYYSKGSFLHDWRTESSSAQDAVNEFRKYSAYPVVHVCLETFVFDWY